MSYQFPGVNLFIDLEKEGQLLSRTNPASLVIQTVRFFPSLLKRSLCTFIRFTKDWGEKNSDFLRITGYWI